jgi:hypothetical protein
MRPVLFALASVPPAAHLRIAVTNRQRPAATRPQGVRSGAAEVTSGKANLLIFARLRLAALAASRRLPLR